MPPNNHNGIQPRIMPTFLPLTTPLIEHITMEADKHPEKEIHLWIKMVFYVTPDKDKWKQGRSDDPPPLLTYCNSSAFQYSVPYPRWQTFLSTWGYPESRLIPIAVALPTPLKSSVPSAEKFWEICSDAYLKATQHRKEHHWAEAGQEFRRSTEYALYTWNALWGNDEPGRNQNVTGAIDGLIQQIPECDPNNGRFPKSRTAVDECRMCARFATLRQLNRMAQASHHIGERPIYTPDDIDYLWSSLGAFLSSLPSFWVEYPKPLKGAEEKE